MPLALALSALCPELHHAPDTLRSFSLFGICRVDALVASALGILTGGGLVYACSIFGKWLFKKEAMGFGDVKLMGMIGGFVGWKLAITVFLLRRSSEFSWLSLLYL